MKQFLMSLTAFFALCGGAAAQQVAVGDVEALPGETVSLSMQLDTDGGSYTGLEFDIQFPQAGFTTGSATTTAAWDGAFTIGDVGGVGITNLARCGVLSYSDTPIPGEGLLDFGTVSFTVDNAVETGDYTVTLTNMTLIGDSRVSVPDATFTLHVVSAHTVVLDEESTTVPEAATGVNVRVKRTLKADVWSSICLPFAMTAAQVEEAFGSDVQLGDFTGAEVSFDASDNVTAIAVNFENATAIEANHPYIIKVSSEITEFTIDGVDLSPDEDEAIIEFDNEKTGSRRVVYSGFYGTYHAGTVLDEKTLFLSNNQFWYSTGNTTMKAFRAYFDFYDVLSSYDDSASGSHQAPAMIRFKGGITGISTAEWHEHTVNGLYNLNGQKIEHAGKGIYIRNGKKVVMK